MIPSPTRTPHVHRYRGLRDTRGREVGFACLTCGDLLAGRAMARGEERLLEALSVGLLAREAAGELELHVDARRKIQSRRRRLARDPQVRAAVELRPAREADR